MRNMCLANITDSMDEHRAAHHSVHMKLSTASSCIASHDLYNSGWHLLRDELELFLELFCLQMQEDMSVHCCYKEGNLGLVELSHDVVDVVPGHHL